MKTIFLFILVSLTAGFLALTASDGNKIKLNGEKNKIETGTCTKNGFIVSSKLSEINTIKVRTPEGIFIKFIMDGYTKSNRAGIPELLSAKSLFEIPCDAEVEVKVLSYIEETVRLEDFGIRHQLFPAQPPVSKSLDPSEIPFIINNEAYKTDKFFSEEPACIEVLGTMRGIRIGKLTLSPLRYNPVTNMLSVLNNLLVEVTFSNADFEKTEANRQKYYSPFFEGSFSRLINYSSAYTKDLITSYPVKYVIVSDPMFETTLQPFVQWKIRKGFLVVEAYTDDPLVGNTTTSIHDYLQNLYTSATAGDPAPSFVLFAGDVAQIPAYSGTTGAHPSDMYYCEFDGSGDYFPDLYFGRFSAENVAELQSQIDKTIEYERYTMADPAFLNENVLVAGVDETMAPVHGNGQINYATDNYFNASHGYNSHVYLYGSGSPITSDDPGASAAIIQNVNDGAGFVNYTAHCYEGGWGDPSFTLNDIPGLTNSGKYSLMIGNCCLSNKFDEDDCFGEVIVKTANKGALGYIGGTNSTLWDEDFYWSVGATTITANPVFDDFLGAYDCVFHENGEPESDWFITNGQMVFAGNLAVTEGATSNIKYYWEIYHLMGDQSVMCYFTVPDPLNVSYSNSAPAGISSLTVTTEQYAYVAISLNGVLLDAKPADATGIVNLSFPPIVTPDTADVVVTKQNRRPHLGTLTVIPNTGPFVLFNSLVVDDTSGNNNGEGDFGENILLDVALNNIGSVNAVNVNATLSESDNYITLTDTDESYGTIVSGDTVTRTDAFAVSIAGNIPDQHHTAFNLSASDGTNTWPSTFGLTFNAPSLHIQFSGVDDSNGSDNGQLDPDESAQLLVNCLNNGHAATQNSTCTLTSSSPYITINTGSVTTGSLGIGGSAPASFGITVSPSTPIGTTVGFVFALTAGAYSAQKTIYLKVGLIVEDWEGNDFYSYDWQQGGNVPWIITTGTPYEGDFAAQSGNISDNQSSVLQITMYVMNNDTIAFFKKVSSEQDYDFLKFYIDNSQQGQWSGNIAWSQEKFAVTTGLHTFKWSFVKDEYVSSGSDCAWIDYVLFPVFDNSGNNVPVFTSLPVTLADVNVPYTYDITATDPDVNDILTITCTNLPAWLSFTDNGNGTAVLTGNPGSGDVGTYNVVLTVCDGTVSINQSFTIAVGMDVENWETGDFSLYTWENDSIYPWIIVSGSPYEGCFAARSADISDNQISDLGITLDILANDEISFYKKVSSEPDYDFLTFSIDGTEEDHWSGEIDWTQESYAVTSGSHTFTWTYSKDENVSNGDDCARLDYIILPVHEVQTVISHSDKTVGELRLQIDPNPAGELMCVRFDLPASDHIILDIRDLTGRTVMELLNNHAKKGKYTMYFTTGNLAEGIYVCLLQAGKKTEDVRLVIFKE
ncbi:MAG: hypothetical protein KJ607_12135 [Bacteroidetes bacterium]|nr:hypothetical protein [Bacteroidota bacterium]